MDPPTHEEIQKSIMAFESDTGLLKHKFCSMCMSVSISMVTKNVNGSPVCRTCTDNHLCNTDFDTRLPLWTDSTGTRRYDLPPELLGLSEAEKLLISPLLLYVPLHHMQKGQIGCKGHVCCFEQNVASVCNSLPRLPDDINLIRVIKQYKDEDGAIAIKTFNVRKSKVLDALRFLKKYSIAFENVVIEEDNLAWMEGEEEYDLPSRTYLEETDHDGNDINEDHGPAIDQTTPAATDAYTEHVLGTTPKVSNSDPALSQAADQNKLLSDATAKSR
jgi:hypothetical protein